MTRFIRWLFRDRSDMHPAFRRSLGYHVLATTHDGVGRWYHRGKA